jgi:beta-lactamase regulating signal transducer with metallopeptidase domain
MIAAWMLYSAVVGALIAAAALAGDSVCRVLRLPVRAVWAGGMIATLVLSSVALLELTAPPSAASPSAVDAGVLVEQTSGEVAPVDALTSLMRRAAGIAGRGADRLYAAAASLAPGGRGLTGAWVLASTLLIVVLSATVLRLGRARRRWRAHRIGEVQVLVSRDAGPALVGLLRPSIVVPEWLLAEPAERQRLVVQHEQEHRRAGDHMLLAVACVIVCLLPWNPALWWMLLRIRLAVELDCDARVLRRGVKPRSYGSLLLVVAGRTRTRPFGAPALADSCTHLERRLIAMTDSNHTPRRTRAAGAGLSGLLLAAAACTADLPTSAAIDDMDVEQAQATAEYAGVLRPLTDKAPLFVVDGIVVDEDAAKEIATTEIGSIEVVKGPAAIRAWGQRAEHGAVLIRTQSADGADAAPVAELRATFSEVKAPLGEPLERTGIVQLRAAGTLRELERSPDEATPLIIIDGVIAGDSFTMSSLAPESIESVEIVKGAAARRLYSDARALHGVIRITTKPGGK